MIDSTISDKRSGSKRRHSGIVLSYAYTIAQVVVNLLYVPILLRGIGASEYGLYQIIGSVMAYILLMNSTFSGGVTRFYCKYYSEGDVCMMETTLAVSKRLYNYATLVSFGVGAAAIAGVRFVYSGTLSDFQIMESSAMLAVLIANLIVTMHNTIDVAVINANERFSFLKITQIATVVIQPIVIVLLIQWYPYALTIVCAQFMTNCICSLVQRLYRRRVLQARVKMHARDTGLMKALLRFSFGVLLVLVADQVFWRTNQLIIGFFYGTSVVAVYGVASQIYAAYGPMGTAISSVFMPYVSRLFYSDRTGKAISDLFKKVGRIATYPLLLVLLGFLVFGREFIVMWAGDGYQDAYTIALLIMMPYTVDLMQNLGLTIMQVENKYTFRGILYSVLAAVNIVAVLIITPVCGPIGAAACTGVLMFVGNGLVMNIFYAKVIELDILGYWKEIVRVATPLCLFGCAAFLLKHMLDISLTDWFSFLVAVVIFGIVYALIAYCASMNQYERDIVLAVIHRRKRS